MNNADIRRAYKQSADLVRNSASYASKYRHMPFQQAIDQLALDIEALHFIDAPEIQASVIFIPHGSEHYFHKTTTSFWNDIFFPSCFLCVFLGALMYAAYRACG